ncbi:MAG: sulfatase [Candidatus Lernaella stagnicola]|nr:sulfatase [Candidatus Lernaella stagnicola]
MPRTYFSRPQIQFVRKGASIKRHRLIALMAYLLLVTLVAAGAVIGCRKKSSPAGPPKGNIILISIDTLRADHVGVYGYPKPTTPNLDSFARDGFMFTQAYAASPWTLPSHGSMFTGLYPMTHGAETIQKRLLDGIPTLAEILQTRGFATGAIVCAPFMRPRFQLNRGFDDYDTRFIYPTDKKTKSDEDRFREVKGWKLANKVTKWGLDWVDRHREKPFFLFLHYWDPHHPYNPEQKYVDLFDPGYKGNIDSFDMVRREDFNPDMDRADFEHIIALYDGEIRYTDDGIGRLLAGLKKRGLTENTMIVITSDHGEEFLEHGGRVHMAQCWQETIHIPLMMQVPWIDRRGVTLDAPVSHVDFLPTFLDLLGVGGAPKLQHGLSLARVIENDEPLPRRELLSQTVRGRLTNHRRGRPGTWTVILTPELRKFHRFNHPTDGFRALFDIGKDPKEQKDLGETYPKDMDRFAGAYSKFVRAFRKEKARLHKRQKSETDVNIEPEFQQQLKDLGYL